MLRSSERVSSSVQKLKLDAYADPFGSFTCPLTMLQQLIHILTHLRILEIFEIYFYPTPGVPIDPTQMRSIDGLEFSIFNESNKYVADTLRLFDTIGELRIGTCRRDILEADPTERRLARVEGLAIAPYSVREEDGRRNIFEMLSAVLDFSVLTRICFKDLLDPVTAQLFSKCHSLKVLDMSDVAVAELRPGLWQSRYHGFPLDLSACTQLRILRLPVYHLRFRTRTSDPPSVPRLELMRNYLASIPASNHLELVEFSICFESRPKPSVFDPLSWPEVGTVERDLGAADWGALDRELCRFEHLQRISFVLKEKCPRGEELIRVMQQRLSEWVRRRTYVYRSITIKSSGSLSRTKMACQDELVRTLGIVAEGPFTVYETDECGGRQVLRLSK